MARLDFYQNGQLFLKLRLDDRPYLIGRGNDCDIMLPDPKVSRMHARLEPSEHGWVLENRGKNGTRVNAELVSERRNLDYGDRIYIESYIVILAQDDAVDAFSVLEQTGTAHRIPPIRRK